jgi:predicted acyl esterase
MSQDPLEASEYGVELHADVMITMRDGVRMATDIYFPTCDGRPIEDTLTTADFSRAVVTWRSFRTAGGRLTRKATLIS